MVKGFVVFVVALVLSMGVGKGVADYRAKHCLGVFDTPKCKRELVAKG